MAKCLNLFLKNFFLLIAFNRFQNPDQKMLALNIKNFVILALLVLLSTKYYVDQGLYIVCQKTISHEKGIELFNLR